MPNTRKLNNLPSGKPITWVVDQNVSEGKWVEERVPSSVTGLPRDTFVFRAPRKTNHLVYFWHGDENTYCPPTWWDTSIGSGPCNFACRSCFLLLTHRINRDPMRHLLYNNLDVFEKKVEKWLNHSNRKPFHVLGVGIDRSDSLLLEGHEPFVRAFASLFDTHNPQGNKMVLLTKSANTHFLEDISERVRDKVVVTFSLNPEEIADLWEGKYPDNGERITPSISKRLEAAKHAQDMGFPVRARLDPIIPVEGWEEIYTKFIGHDIKDVGVSFEYITLGTYREKNNSLDTWREKWGLLPLEWEPTELVNDGTHWHLSKNDRQNIYKTVAEAIRKHLGSVQIGLCKETHDVRKKVGLSKSQCNCLHG